VTTIELKLFGVQAQQAGCARMRVELAQSRPTCADLRRRVAEVSPELAATLGVSRFAINHAFAPEEQLIHGDDEVALIGMVSGG
jgi:molybdopterin converting factor small subunit